MQYAQYLVPPTHTMILRDAAMHFNDIVTGAGELSDDSVPEAADGPAAAAHPRPTASAGFAGLTSRMSVRSYQGD